MTSTDSASFGSGLAAQCPSSPVMLCDGQGVFFVAAGRQIRTAAGTPYGRVTSRATSAHESGCCRMRPARTATPCSAWSELDSALPGAVRCARTGESSSPPSDTVCAGQRLALGVLPLRVRRMRLCSAARLRLLACTAHPSRPAGCDRASELDGSPASGYPGLEIPRRPSPDDGQLKLSRGRPCEAARWWTAR
jgi:hypothetical protein